MAMIFQKFGIGNGLIKESINKKLKGKNESSQSSSNLVGAYQLMQQLGIILWR
jgi:hypothetical protein